MGDLEKRYFIAFVTSDLSNITTSDAPQWHTAVAVKMDRSLYGFSCTSDLEPADQSHRIGNVQGIALIEKSPRVLTAGKNIPVSAVRKLGGGSRHIGGKGNQIDHIWITGTGDT